tara:strand:+ start:16949 stop:18046 length:1098 start_codon:yes stop_codon:yes gene_type:complete
MEQNKLDITIFYATLFLAVFGLIAIYSASITISEKYYHDSFYFLQRQAIYLVLAFALGYLLYQVDLKTLIKASLLIYIIINLLLIFILFFGVSVNGSKRWINLYIFKLQVSELLKFNYIILLPYLIGYKNLDLNNVKSFITTLIILCIPCIFVMLEPDLGSCVVITLTFLTVLYISGAKKSYFLLLISLALILLSLAIIYSPYRLQRIVAFLDPWKNQFTSGYQLTQALIAYGRGDFWGLGLGASVQKLFFLPEAHTDFILAIIAEEQGFLGLGALFLVYLLFISLIFYKGYISACCEKQMESLLCYSAGCYFFWQIAISIGVNLGLLPTKGLTLPFVSYGGSSLLVNYCIVILILKVNFQKQEY